LKYIKYIFQNIRNISLPKICKCNHSQGSTVYYCLLFY
jgi:hypothetical protein